MVLDTAGATVGASESLTPPPKRRRQVLALERPAHAAALDSIEPAVDHADVATCAREPGARHAHRVVQLSVLPGRIPARHLAEAERAPERIQLEGEGGGPAYFVERGRVRPTKRPVQTAVPWPAGKGSVFSGPLTQGSSFHTPNATASHGTGPSGHGPGGISAASRNTMSSTADRVGRVGIRILEAGGARAAASATGQE